MPRGLARVPLTILGWLADTGATCLLCGLERVQEHGDGAAASALRHHAEHPCSYTSRIMESTLENRLDAR